MREIGILLPLGHHHGPGPRRIDAHFLVGLAKRLLAMLSVVPVPTAGGQSRGGEDTETNGKAGEGESEGANGNEGTGEGKEANVKKGKRGSTEVSRGRKRATKTETRADAAVRQSQLTALSLFSKPATHTHLIAQYSTALQKTREAGSLRRDAMQGKAAGKGKGKGKGRGRGGEALEDAVLCLCWWRDR